MSSFPSHNVGLVNLGNTCFLNSVLQALRLCPPLMKVFLADPTRTLATRTETKKGPLMSAFQTLLRDVWTAEDGGSLIPRGFVATLGQTVRDCDDDWYRPRQQADSAECLQYILDALHDAIYRRVNIRISGEARNTEERAQLAAMEAWSQFFAKEYSPIVEHMFGQNQSQVRCESCGHTSNRYEPWSMLKLPIPGGDVPGSSVPSMTDCLNAAHELERIEDYQCDGCKGRHVATIANKISRLPTVLILVLKRFTNTGAKIRGRVAWDLDSLDLSPWLAFSRCPYTDSPTQSVYESFAVIEHMGSANGGHYRTFARDFGGDMAPWTEYDDSAVRGNVPPSEIVNEDSYIVFLTPRESRTKLHAMTMAAVNGLASASASADGQKASK
jgi:ubiquitin carboxyl-terminal hydrolase 8